MYIYISSWGNLKNKLYNFHKPLSCFCFIDDVDMKWTESEENLHRFFDLPTMFTPL